MFYNCHIHIFRDIDVPRKFLPLGLVRILSTKRGFRIISRIINNLNPFSDNDALDRYIRFFKITKKKSQEEIFNYCKLFYPSSTKFIVLPMDMAYMNAGKVPREFKDQLIELSDLSKKDPQIIPFMHTDPRREGVLDLLKEFVEEHDFKGIKIYPTLGYFPYDERLYPIYEYCQEKGLPVIAHCSPYNPVRYRGTKKELKEMLSSSILPFDINNKSPRELCSFFAYPKNYEKVLNDFPNLKICTAHFGSSDQWDEYIYNPLESMSNNWFVIIKDMLEKYSNFYSDISMTLYRPDFFPLLKILLEDPMINKKILFGSDFYMTEREDAERQFGIEIRAYLGEEKFKLISYDNIIDFLG